MTIIPYSEQHKELWDTTLRQSRFPALLLERGFMDYHADRFEDASLMVCDEKGRVEVLIASSIRRDTNTIVSHGGLTYGGLIPSVHAGIKEIMEALGLACEHYRSLGAIRWILKPVPWAYWSIPSEEVLYAMTQHGAVLKTRALSNCVALDAMQNAFGQTEDAIPQFFSEMRRRHVRKCRQEGVKVMIPDNESDSLENFWSILTKNLSHRHGVAPVHSIEEMKLLMQRFPERIYLATAMKGGEILAGCVCFIASPQLVHVQYISAADEGRNNNALDLLFAELVGKVATEYKYLDFGISTLHDGTGINEGLMFQKHGYGARGMCYDTYEIAL